MKLHNREGTDRIVCCGISQVENFVLKRSNRNIFLFQSIFQQFLEGFLFKIFHDLRIYWSKFWNIREISIFFEIFEKSRFKIQKSLIFDFVFKNLDFPVFSSKIWISEYFSKIWNFCNPFYEIYEFWKFETVFNRLKYRTQSVSNR